MSEPLIQIVDEHDQPVGEASITQAQTEGLFHRIVFVIVRDKLGNVLLQKRASSVDRFPDCWDVSAGGHVDAGEDYKIAAKRELVEELGIKNMELELLGSFSTNFEEGTKRFNRFNRVYGVVVSREMPLQLQPTELASVKWFTVPEIRKLVSECPDEVADGIEHIFARGFLNGS